MLKHLQKFFAGQPAQPALADNKEEVGMNETEKATFAAAELKAAELSVALEAATATLADKEAAMAELSAKFETAQAALNASEAAQAELAKQAAEKRLETRTAAITAAVGTGKVEALLAATDAMADEQFNVIVSAMAASFDAQAAKNPAFKEAGVPADLVVDDKPTHFKTFIKSKE
jgi:hypothetical protein